jgi:hypothetical protein
MAHHPKLRIISIAIGVFVILGVLVTIPIYWCENRPISIDQLWEKEYEHRNLEGKTVTVRGDMIFEPLSDFRFNSLYLVDSKTPEEYRMPSQGFWFGLRIDGVSCMLDDDKAIVSCEPFDPSQGKIFEFKGTIHVDQVGKKEIMWMSDIDFEHSRQWIDGKWEPIPLGQFIIPLEKN